MPNPPFDATITIGHHHLRAAGLDPQPCTAAMVEVVRGAIERLDGASWIDVAVADFPSTCPGWVTLYPRGSSARPDTPVWQARRHEVEELIKAVLVTMAVPV